MIVCEFSFRSFSIDVVPYFIAITILNNIEKARIEFNGVTHRVPIHFLPPRNYFPVPDYSPVSENTPGKLFQSIKYPDGLMNRTSKALPFLPTKYQRMARDPVERQMPPPEGEVGFSNFPNTPARYYRARPYVLHTSITKSRPLKVQVSVQ